MSENIISFGVDNKQELYQDALAEMLCGKNQIWKQCIPAGGRRTSRNVRVYDINHIDNVLIFEAKLYYDEIGRNHDAYTGTFQTTIDDLYLYLFQQIAD